MRVLGITGYSGAGKTTLIEKLILILNAEGVVVSVIKHVHCAFDIDQPGKDSYRQRHAGAAEVLVASDKRWALMHENRSGIEPPLRELLTKLSPCDLVLVEGWKRDPIPKLEVHRAANGKPWLYPDDPDILAVVSDVPPPDDKYRLALDDVASIRAFIRKQVGV
ncbi:MAG: molybdopterin-guanine dinucleotide biosynthesis protein B [Hydrogenophilaceae bacterium]|nr:molybdopterin-guanine dinucleotide biosynthesis protein B [Hydrogenophilaceae bacterium]